MTEAKHSESAWARSVREGKFMSGAAALAVAAGGFFTDLNAPAALRTAAGGAVGYLGAVIWIVVQQRDEVRAERRRHAEDAEKSHADAVEALRTAHELELGRARSERDAARATLAHREEAAQVPVRRLSGFRAMYQRAIRDGKSIADGAGGLNSGSTLEWARELADLGAEALGPPLQSEFARVVANAIAVSNRVSARAPRMPIDIELGMEKVLNRIEPCDLQDSFQPRASNDWRVPRKQSEGT